MASGRLEPFPLKWNDRKRSGSRAGVMRRLCCTGGKPRAVNGWQFSPLIIPTRTIVRVVIAIFLVWLVIQLWHVLLLVFMAFLVAAALSPLVHRLEGRGWSVGAAVGALILVVLGCLGVGIWYLVPQMVSEGQGLVDKMPEYIDRAQVLLEKYPAINERVQGYFQPSDSGGEAPSVPVSRVIEVGNTVIGALVDTFVVLVMAIYILLDGERVYSAAARFLSPVQQAKFRRSMPEIVTVISGYVVGQFITSLLFGIFVFGTLTVLDVPQPLLLALLAAFMDAIPLVGVPLATIPAVLAGLTVSPSTAVAVLVLYTVYQQIENYLLVPRIYGRTLNVSPLTVLVGVLVGGELLGIVGILLALPLTAAIPIFVHLWRDDVETPVLEMPDTPAIVEVPRAEHF
jgi:predicted PurR-regulated permease PerM